MATIGVDSTGKPDSLPMKLVASRGTECRVIEVTHIPREIKTRYRHWKQIAYACYAFYAIRPLFRKNPLDTVLIDRDFDEVGLERVTTYVRHLIKEYFKLPHPCLVEAGDDHDLPVHDADRLCSAARRGKLKSSLHNPSIGREMELLKPVL